MDYPDKEEITREEAENANECEVYGLNFEDMLENFAPSVFNDSGFEDDRWYIDPQIQEEEAEGITEDSYIKIKKKN